MTDEQQIQDEVALAIDLEEQGHIKVKKKNTNRISKHSSFNLRFLGRKPISHLQQLVKKQFKH
jgi:hypothetical protein